MFGCGYLSFFGVECGCACFERVYVCLEWVDLVVVVGFDVVFSDVEVLCVECVFGVVRCFVEVVLIVAVVDVCEVVFVVV